MTNDPVRHPAHYTFGKYEVWDVIADWELDYFTGNAVKYIARAGRKPPGDPEAEIRDIGKAIRYLTKHIAMLEDKQAAGVAEKNRKMSEETSQ